MIKVKINGEIRKVEPMSLKDMQEFVGGYIEIVPYLIEDNEIVICNEDGLIQTPPLPRNQLYPRFVGNIILARKDEVP